MTKGFSSLAVSLAWACIVAAGCFAFESFRQRRIEATIRIETEVSVRGRTLPVIGCAPVPGEGSTQPLVILLVADGVPIGDRFEWTWQLSRLGVAAVMADAFAATEGTGLLQLEQGVRTAFGREGLKLPQVGMILTVDAPDRGRLLNTVRFALVNNYDPVLLLAADLDRRTPLESQAEAIDDPFRGSFAEQAFDLVVVSDLPKEQLAVTLDGLARSFTGVRVATKVLTSPMSHENLRAVVRQAIGVRPLRMGADWLPAHPEWAGPRNLPWQGFVLALLVGFGVSGVARLARAPRLRAKGVWIVFVLGGAGLLGWVVLNPTKAVCLVDRCLGRFDPERQWLTQQLGPEVRPSVCARMALCRSASQQRGRFYRQLPQAVYEEALLSPVVGRLRIDPALQWSLRTLTAPRMRGVSAILPAARQIGLGLQEGLTLAYAPRDKGVNVVRSLRSGLLDDKLMPAVYVAALRANGIAATLTPEHRVRIFDGGTWIDAPALAWERDVK